MRRDAARNRETILTSAIGVLVDAPHASMREIAEASGTGRTTLYRHFVDRKALIDAVMLRVYREADALIATALEAPAARESPVATLATLAVELAALGDRYRFLQHARADEPAAEDRAESEAVMRAFVEDGQRSGALRGDLGAGWLLDVYGALVRLAAEKPASDDRAQLRMTVVALLAPLCD